MRRITYRVFYSGVWWKAVTAAKGRPMAVVYDGAYVEARSGWDAVVVAARLLVHSCKLKAVQKVVR